MALGLIVLEAAEALAQGKSREEILSRIKYVQKNLVVYFTVGDLENLSRTGRIDEFPSCLGSLVNAKPVLTIEKGRIIAVDKIRGNLGRIHRRLLELTRERLGYAGEDLYPSCRRWSKQNGWKRRPRVFTGNGLQIVPIGPVVGAHTGSGAFGWWPWRFGRMRITGSIYGDEINRPLSPWAAPGDGPDPEALQHFGRFLWAAVSWISLPVRVRWGLKR